MASFASSARDAFSAKTAASVINVNPTHLYAGTSIGTFIIGLLAYAIPALQVLALLVSIAAGIKALRKKDK